MHPCRQDAAGGGGGPYPPGREERRRAPFPAETPPRRGAGFSRGGCSGGGAGFGTSSPSPERPPLSFSPRRPTACFACPFALGGRENSMGGAAPQPFPPGLPRPRRDGFGVRRSRLGAHRPPLRNPADAPVGDRAEGDDGPHPDPSRRVPWGRWPSRRASGGSRASRDTGTTTPHRSPRMGVCEGRKGGKDWSG